MMEIVIPDMGHGNCIGFFDEMVQPFLVDCGTRNNRKTGNFTKLIRPRLEKSKSRVLVITHYHYDHYSLLIVFARNFFNDIYLPALPTASVTAQAICHFLALASVFQYGNYYLTSAITSRGRNIHPLVKDTSFSAMDRNWEVLWPDYTIIDRMNARKIRTIFEKIDTVKSRLNDDQSREFEKIYGYLSRSFCEDSKKMDIPAREQRGMAANAEIDAETKDALGSIERIFKDLANRASLVVRDESCDFLLTGDIDDEILNRHLDFGARDYFLIEAPHHGGYYGYAFDNTSAEVLVISRRATYKIRPEYFRDLHWRTLIDTARNGNCIVRPMTRRGRVVLQSRGATYFFVP